MEHKERIAPVAALLSLLSTLLCCLPLGFATAAGAASLGFASGPLRPYLMGLSAVLLAFGFWQLYRAKQSCQRRSPLSIAVLWLSAIAVVAGLVVPQTFANLLTGSWRPGGGAQLVELRGGSLEQLRDAFNRASGNRRVILLLSPT